jgi:hypothetical protein
MTRMHDARAQQEPRTTIPKKQLILSLYSRNSLREIKHETNLQGDSRASEQ